MGSRRAPRSGPDRLPCHTRAHARGSAGQAYGGLRDRFGCVIIGIHAPMISPPPADGKWNERSSAPGLLPVEHETMFQLLFERSAEAIWLLDPENLIFVDCNQAAV